MSTLPRRTTDPRVVPYGFARRYGRAPDLDHSLDLCRLAVLARHEDDIEDRARRLYDRAKGVRVRLPDGDIELISEPPFRNRRERRRAGRKRRRG